MKKCHVCVGMLSVVCILVAPRHARGIEVEVSARRIRTERVCPTYDKEFVLEGSPIALAVGVKALGKPEGFFSYRPADSGSWSLFGVRITSRETGEIFVPRLIADASTIKVFCTREGHLFEMDFYFFDKRLRAGFYSLEFIPHEGPHGISVQSFSPPHMDLEVRSPTSNDERYSLGLSYAYYCMKAHKLAECERTLVQLMLDFPDCAGPYSMLRFLYHSMGLDKARMIEYSKETVRRYCRGRHLPEEELNKLPRACATYYSMDYRYEPFVEGVLQEMRHYSAFFHDEDQAKRISEVLTKSFQDIWEGKDTGRLPAEYKKPLLSP